MIKRSLYIFLVVLGSIFLLAACGSKETEKSAENGEEVEIKHKEEKEQKEENKAEKTPDYPRTIEHAEGTITLEKKPERVAITDVNATDYVIALDEVPIGARIASRDRSPKLFELTEGLDIANLGGKVNMEALIGLEPDLIILTEGKGSNYDRDSKVAPTIVVEGSNDRRKRLRQIAEIFAKEEKAEELLKELDDKIDEAKKVVAKREGETALFLRANGKDFTVLTPDEYGLLYEEVGLKSVGQFPDQGQVGVESISEADPDHLFLVENRRQMDPENPNALISIWDEHPVWQNLRAVKNNQMYVLDPLVSDSFFYGQHLELDAIIEHLGK